MITYVDTSTLIKLIVEEPGSESAAQIWAASDSLVSVSLVEVEARAALAAARRAGRLTPAAHRRARAILVQLLEQVDTVEVTHDLVASAGDLAESHGLRGYDAVHLAAARLVGCDVMSSADTDLCAAAERDGFHIANPLG